MLNAFALDQGSLPAGWLGYWAAKGVVSGATGWQGVMWEIINGNAPFFYLKLSGGDVPAHRRAAVRHRQR